MMSATKSGVLTSFGYDPQQNRFKKATPTATDFYIRDAQGNVLAIYQKNSTQFLWKEQHLYGSSRLGIWQTETNIKGTYNLNVAAMAQSARQYELTNHLGNVLSTITDKGVITSAQDYFPFGLTLASRSFTEGGSAYRFSFNGKEDDKGLKQQDYGMRIYRPDLGRFLSVDPIGRQYPELTPYQFASNTPIQAIDLDGLEAFFVSGAGGDAIGWNYTQRFKNKFAEQGFDFRPIKASHSWEWTQKQGVPPISDMSFTASYRKSGWISVPKNDNTLTGGINSVNVRLATTDAEVLKVVETIRDQKDSKKQLNLIGYSYGSVVMAHAALAASDAGIKIDNLILIGSPIPSNSELFKELSSKMHVIRYDIQGDLLSDPKTDSDFLSGVKQNSSDAGPHFNLARPDDPKTTHKNEEVEANGEIEKLVKFLKDNGVKDKKQ